MTEGTAESELARLKSAYRQVFGGPGGQAVLEDLAAAAGLADAGYADQPHIDPLALASRDGKRRIVLRILSFIGQSELDVVTATLRRQHDRSRQQRQEAHRGQT